MPLPSRRERVPVRHRIPLELSCCEVPAAALVDQLIAIASGGAQRGTVPRRGEQQCHAALGRIDSVDADVVVDGDQTPLLAGESLTQIGEFRPVASETGAEMAEGRNPSVAVAVGKASV